MYNQNLSIADALGITDLDYIIFLKENAVIFEFWKGALTHEQLCRIDLETRRIYIEELNKQIKDKNRRKQAEANAFKWRK